MVAKTERKGHDLIIAMDKMPLEGDGGVRELVQKIGATGSLETMKRVIFKINDLLADIGMRGVKEFITSLEKEGFDTSKINWMFDPKWNDIPNTIENYFEKLDSNNIENVRYVTIMAAGGRKMMKKAVETRNKLGMKTKILAVTVLTSMDDDECKGTFNETTKHQVLKYAKTALESGIDGIVCSPIEAEMLKEVYGDLHNFEIVTPGIRLKDAVVSGDDQERTRTPEDAIKGGSDHLVMGRPIIKSEDRIRTIEEILEEMDGAEYTKTEKYAFEKMLYTGSWEQLIKYIGAIYNRPEGGKYVRLASKLISDGYVNIGATERNFRVIERASDELASQINSDYKNLVSMVKASAKTETEQEKIRYDKLAEEIKNDTSLQEWERTMHSLNLDAEHKEFNEAIQNSCNEAIRNVQKADMVLGAQMGSVRLSLTLAKALDISESIYTEKDGDEMKLKRHDVDFRGKNVILSEDVITKGSTLEKMIRLVEDGGGKVIGITCVVNRSGKDNFMGISIKSCYTPKKFGMFYDGESIYDKLKKFLKEDGYDSNDIEDIMSGANFLLEGGFDIKDRDWIISTTTESLEKDTATCIKDAIDSFFKEFDESGIIPFTQAEEIEQNPKASWNGLVSSMNNA